MHILKFSFYQLKGKQCYFYRIFIDEEEVHKSEYFSKLDDAKQSASEQVKLYWLGGEAEAVEDATSLSFIFDSGKNPKTYN